MEPNDKELRQQLSRGPLNKNGFDESLIRRIEYAIDQPFKKPSIFRRLGWHGAGLAAIASLLLIVGIWQWAAPDSATDPINAALTKSNGQEVALFASPSATPSSALLLGLRTDDTAANGNVSSSYRTLLIAPSGDHYELAAQGDGIVMPYKTNFWKIESSHSGQEESAVSQLLFARQATGKGAAAAEKQPEGTSMISSPGLNERLLFVGNEYISVVQNRSDSPGKQYRWVKTVSQLADETNRNVDSFDPANEPHVALKDALEDAPESAPASSEATEQWSIIRHTGSWTAAVADAPTTDSYAPFTADTKLRELSTPLPEKINKHDKLALSWSQLLTIVPDPLDAYSSNDMLAVVTKDELRIYPYLKSGGKENPLIVPLKSNETVIMAQWAIESKYVESWQKEVVSVLQSNR